DVLDRGPGIGARDASLVFERFHRADSGRTLPGSGLGLSIVRDVVARNGGTVHAAARDGGGAAVGFVVPLAP
ncbi:MAG: sensor histidine kinase, partial [Actinomycetota bacterium]|nr:sensor histidine kinase [Actinomycetota bacterium]